MFVCGVLFVVGVKTALPLAEGFPVGKNPALSLGMTQREVGKPHSEGWFRTEIH